MDSQPTKITLGKPGDIVEIDISHIGPARGYRLYQVCKGDRTPMYVTELILAAAEGHSTPHEIDADWVENNVFYRDAAEVVNLILSAATKNTISPTQSI